MARVASRQGLIALSVCMVLLAACVGGGDVGPETTLAPSTTTAETTTTSTRLPATTTATTPRTTTTTTVEPSIDWEYTDATYLPTVTVLDPGKEPTERRSYDPEVGASATVSMRNEFSIVQSINGGETTNLATEIDTEITVVPVAVDESGIIVEETYGISTVSANDPTAQAVIESLSAQLDGATRLLLMSPQGGMLAQSGGELPPGLLDLTEGLSGATVPLPTEPIGVGAEWEAVARVEVAGTTFIQTTTVRLTGIDGSLLTLEMDVVQKLGPEGLVLPGVETVEADLTTSGTGKAVLDLTAPVPVRASSSANQTMMATLAVGGEEATLNQTVSTSMSMDMETGEVLKIAFVHVGSISDKSWTWSHYQGARHLKANMDGVRIQTLEFIPEGDPSLDVFRDLAAQGTDLIFGTSFGYMDPMLQAAADFPETTFLHATGYKASSNMGNYSGAAEEGSYLSGMVAGASTESDVIGYVAAFPIPEVLRGINAFTLGAREVNPQARVHVLWTSTWFDPPVEGSVAQMQLDAGADVIAMHQDSPAIGQVAEAGGAKWVGHGTDMTEFAPVAWLTAPTWNWGPYYLETAEAVRAGTWQSASYYGTMSDGMVLLAPFGDSVDRATRRSVQRRETKIIDGTFSIFSDPIINQDGESQPLGNILEMDYFVEGVVGSTEP